MSTAYREKPGSPGDILEHYGVKGMRWGVRKEEDTSSRGESGKLEKIASKGSTKPEKAVSRKSTKSEKAASGAAVVPVLSERAQKRTDKFMSRADVMDTRIAELRARNEKLLKGSDNPAKTYERYANNQSVKQFEKSKAQAIKDAEAVKKGKLTSTQKKLIIGGVAVAGIVAYGAVVRGQQSGALNSYQMLAEARLRGQKVPFNVNKELSGKMSAADILSKVVRPVNPGYSSPGGQMNCRRSTYVYELRRRGFDVHATTSAVGWGQSESGVINALTPGSRNFYDRLSVSQAVVRTGGSTVARGDARVRPIAKTILDKLGTGGPDGVTAGYGSRKVFETLAKQPNGSRGEVLFKFPNFGHSMAYEVIDGKPHIFDSQKGTYHDLTKLIEDKWGNFNGAEITRLDNVDMDLKFLTRWAANNRGKK